MHTKIIFQYFLINFSLSQNFPSSISIYHFHWLTNHKSCLSKINWHTAEIKIKFSEFHWRKKIIIFTECVHFISFSFLQKYNNKKYLYFHCKVTKKKIWRNKKRNFFISPKKFYSIQTHLIFIFMNNIEKWWDQLILIGKNCERIIDFLPHSTEPTKNEWRKDRNEE